MTEFNKGDIVYPTAEFQENRAGLLNDTYADGLDPERAAASREQDQYLADGKPLRIVANGPQVLGVEFLFAVRPDSERTDLDLRAFAENPGESQYDDIFFIVNEEVEQDGGVLAGV